MPPRARSLDAVVQVCARLRRFARSVMLSFRTFANDPRLSRIALSLSLLFSVQQPRTERSPTSDQSMNHAARRVQSIASQVTRNHSTMSPYPNDQALAKGPEGLKAEGLVLLTTNTPNGQYLPPVTRASPEPS